MPTSIQVGVFVLGGVLILIAILGGKFKLFGAEIEATISNTPLRFVAGILGSVLLTIVLFTHNQSQPRPSIPSVDQNLQVYANSSKGMPWTNEENDVKKVSFDATGTWLAIPEDVSNPQIPDDAKGYLTPNGDPNFNSNVTVCARVPLGALVIVGKDEQCKAYGAKGSFKIKSTETVYFKMNDIHGGFKDNDGFIDIKLSISKP